MPPEQEKVSTLPEEAAIRDYYDGYMRQIERDYIARRWGSSPIQRSHFRQTRRALARALAVPPRWGDVLEVGCGPAVWTELFIGRVERLLLVDISSEMLAAAKARIESWNGGAYGERVDYRCGDATSLDLGSDRFDVVVSMRAFEYMGDKTGFLRKCQAALRPGGYLILGTKSGRWMDMRSGRKAAAGSAPAGVREAMQSDLLEADDVAARCGSVGLTVHGVFPLVFGSYRWPLSAGPAVWGLERLHAWLHRRPLGPAAGLVESYVVIAMKPAN